MAMHALALAIVAFSAPRSMRPHCPRAAVRLSDLGDAASEAAARETEAARKAGLSNLDALTERMNSRLNQLGASEAPPPPPPAVERSAFAISSGQSSDKKAEAAERLQRLRAKDNGELEADGAATIAAARRMSKQWADAGLAARAEKEMERAAAL